MEITARPSLPAFGNWDSFDDLAMARYFESTTKLRCPRRDVDYGRSYVYQPPPFPRCFYYGFEPDGSLYRVPVHAPMVISDCSWKLQRRAEMATEKQILERESVTREWRYQNRVHHSSDADLLPTTPHYSLKAVDEDLYEVPQVLRRKRSKRKIVLPNCWSRCLGTNCYA
ncbi:uncharacterized protein LOC144716114 isoform X2 [Wolffia australiana]